MKESRKSHSWNGTSKEINADSKKISVSCVYVHRLGRALFLSTLYSTYPSNGTCQIRHSHIRLSRATYLQSTELVTAHLSFGLSVVGYRLAPSSAHSNFCVDQPHIMDTMLFDGNTKLLERHRVKSLFNFHGHGNHGTDSRLLVFT